MNKPHKAAVTERPIKLNGVVYRLRFDFLALAALEDHYGRPATEIAAGFVTVDPVTKKATSNVRIRDLQAIIWAGMRRHHPEVSVDGVLDLMQASLDSGQPFEAMLTDALNAFDAGQDSGTDGGPDDKPSPPPAAAGADAT